MNSVINGLMNLILVSVPEETIWVLTTLIFLKRFDLLDKYRWKENLKWIIIPVILSSLSINILRYIINAPRLTISLTAILTIYIGIIIILKSRNVLNEKIPYIKTFTFVILIFALMIVLVECLYAPFLITYVKKSIIEVNNIWTLNFLLSIPARLIQLLIIIIILTIQNKTVIFNTIQSIFLDKRISFTIISFVTTLIIFWTLLIDIFGDYNIYAQFSINKQILFSVLLLLVPSILLVLMIYLIILFITKINQIQQSHQNMFDDNYKY